MSRMDEWDAVVVGAGPAGSIAALVLAGRGHAVLLLDRADFPRDKPCGGALLADSLAVLRRHGLLAEILPRALAFSELVLSSPSRIQVTVPARVLVLRREFLDDRLRAAALRAGAQGRTAPVESVAGDPAGGFVVGTTTGEAIRARCVIVATGAGGGILAASRARAAPRPSAVAMRQLLVSTARLERPLISFDRSIRPGYAWIFPLGDDLYNLGCGVFLDRDGPGRVNLHALLRRFLATFPPAAELVAGGRRQGRPRGGCLRCGLTGEPPLSPGGVLFAGEAIGTTYGLTGEGIGKAMESAEMAAEAADAFLRSGQRAALASYADGLRDRLGPGYDGYRASQRWLAQPWLIDLVCRRVVGSRHLQARAAGILAGREDPRRLFSIVGLLRSLVR